MDFKFLNDTICGIPRLVIIVDDTSKDLEETTKAVFPAARICLDTMNQRNRMIVLIDHATEEVKKVAQDFFMKPDSKVTVKIVAMPHTEALRAEKPAESTVQPEQTAAAENNQEQEDLQNRTEEKTQPESEEAGREEAPQQTEPAEPAHAKRAGILDIWGDDDNFGEIWKESNSRFRSVKDTMHPEDSAKAFMNLMEQDCAKRGKKTLVMYLQWFDAIGGYGQKMRSTGAIQAARQLQTAILKSKALGKDSKACLQNVPGLTYPVLKTMRDKAHAESFASYFDGLSKEEQLKLTVKILQTVDFGQNGKKNVK